MKILRNILLVSCGILLCVSIYRGLTRTVMVKTDSLLIVGFSLIILIVTFIDRFKKSRT
jgi:hypothetical protein